MLTEKYSESKDEFLTNSLSTCIRAQQRINIPYHRINIQSPMILLFMFNQRQSIDNFSNLLT